jgi:hypothetical protein
MTSTRVRLVLVLVVFLAVTVGATLWVWHLPSARHQIAESTSQQPATFTELYFSDAAALPKHLSSAAPNVFWFTIANHEGKTVVYSFLVFAESTLGRTTISQGQVNLAAGQHADVPERYMAPQPGTAYQITIQLLDRPEAIHFTGMS